MVQPSALIKLLVRIRMIRHAGLDKAQHAKYSVRVERSKAKHMLRQGEEKAQCKA